MTRLPRLIAAFVAAFVSAAAPVPPNFTDLTGDYAQFYHTTEAEALAARVAGFKALMARKFPGFYTAERAGTSEQRYDQRIADSFAEFPGIEAKFTASAKALQPQLQSALVDFRRAFPDAGKSPPVYLIHSLGQMDGSTVDMAGRTVLVFGADVIATVHRAGANERPFLQHEIFHTYHEPRLGGCKPLWCTMWREGLAVYVSARLNPGATDDELLLTKIMRTAADADRQTAICALRDRAMSTSEDDSNALFAVGPHLPRLPERAGYYIGYLVAQQIGRETPMAKMASWNAITARPRVLAALAELAPSCPRAP